MGPKKTKNTSAKARAVTLKKKCDVKSEDSVSKGKVESKCRKRKECNSELPVNEHIIPTATKRSKNVSMKADNDIVPKTTTDTCNTNVNIEKEETNDAMEPTTRKRVKKASKIADSDINTTTCNTNVNMEIDTQDKIAEESCDKSPVASVSEPLLKCKNQRNLAKKSTPCKVILTQVDCKVSPSKRKVKSRNTGKRGRMTKSETDETKNVKEKKSVVVESNKEVVVCEAKLEKDNTGTNICSKSIITSENKSTTEADKNIHQTSKVNQITGDDDLSTPTTTNHAGDCTRGKSDNVPKLNNQLNDSNLKTERTADADGDLPNKTTNASYDVTDEPFSGYKDKIAEKKTSDQNKNADPSIDAASSRTNIFTMFQDSTVTSCSVNSEAKTDNGNANETKNIDSVAKVDASSTNASHCIMTPISNEVKQESVCQTLTVTAIKKENDCSDIVSVSCAVDVEPKSKYTDQSNMKPDSVNEDKQGGSSVKTDIKQEIVLKTEIKQEIGIRDTNMYNYSAKVRSMEIMFNEIKALLQETLSKSLTSAHSKSSLDSFKSNLTHLQRHLIEIAGLKRQSKHSSLFYQFQSNLMLIQQKLAKVLKGKLAFFIKFQQQMKLILPKLLVILHATCQAQFRRQCLEIPLQKTAQEIIEMSKSESPPISIAPSKVHTKSIQVVAKPTISSRPSVVIPQQIPNSVTPLTPINSSGQFNQPPQIPNFSSPPVYPQFPRLPAPFPFPCPPNPPPPPFQTQPFVGYSQPPFISMMFPNYPPIPPTMPSVYAPNVAFSNPTLMRPSMAPPPPIPAPSPFGVLPPPIIPHAAIAIVKTESESHTESNELDYFLGITNRQDYTKADRPDDHPGHRESRLRSRSRSNSRGSYDRNRDDFRRRSLSSISNSSFDENDGRGPVVDRLPRDRHQMKHDAYRSRNRSHERSPINDQLDRKFDAYSSRHSYNSTRRHMDSPRRRSESYRESLSPLRRDSRRSHSHSPFRHSSRQIERDRGYSPVSQDSLDDYAFKNTEKRHAGFSRGQPTSRSPLSRISISDDDGRRDDRFSPVLSGEEGKSVHGLENRWTEQRRRDEYIPVSEGMDERGSERPEEAAWSLFDRLRSRRDSGSLNIPESYHDSAEQPRLRTYNRSPSGEFSRRRSRSRLSRSKQSLSSRSLSRSRSRSRERSMERYRSREMEASNSVHQRHFKGKRKSKCTHNQYENCSSSEDEQMFQTSSYSRDRSPHLSRRYDAYGGSRAVIADNTHVTKLDPPSSYSRRIEKHPDHESVSSGSLDGEQQADNSLTYNQPDKNIIQEDKSTGLTKYDLVKHILSGQPVADIYNSCAKKPDVLQAPNMGYAQSYLTGNYNEIPQYTPVDEVNIKIKSQQVVYDTKESGKMDVPVQKSNENEEYIRRDWEFPHKGVLMLSIDSFKRESDAYKDELVAELVHILITVEHSKATFRTLLSIIRERMKIQFQSVADLKAVFELYPDNFIIIESDADWDNEIYSHSGMHRQIKAKTNIGFCEAHSHLLNRAEHTECCTCNALHICKFYVISKCDAEECKCGHVVKTQHNINVLAQHRLHRTTVGQLLSFLGDFENRNSGSIPRICPFYNNRFCYNDGKGQNATCRDLHLCQQFALGSCKCCKRTHSILHGQVRSLLEQYGLDPDVIAAPRILHCLKRIEMDRLQNNTDGKTSSSGKKLGKTGSTRSSNTCIDARSVLSRFQGIEPETALKHIQSTNVSLGEPGPSSNVVKCLPRLPQICKFYNLRSGCKMADWDHGKACIFLHVCQHFVEGDCKFGVSCIRSHDLLNEQVITVFKSFRINIEDLNVNDVLELIQICLKWYTWPLKGPKVKI